MKVALYGGSFNPPHVCHVLVATWVVCREPVDEIWALPVYKHAFGKEMAPFDTRVAMLEAAFGHLGPKVRVCTIERELGGTSYTIDTVRALLRRRPDLELSFVCGTDLFVERHKWKAWDELDALLDFVVVGREGEPDPEGVRIRARLPDISSTEIRRRVSAGEPYGAFVPRPVRRIVEAEGLYR